MLTERFCFATFQFADATLRRCLLRRTVSKPSVLSGTWVTHCSDPCIYRPISLEYPSVNYMSLPALARGNSLHVEPAAHNRRGSGRIGTPISGQAGGNFVDSGASQGAS